MLASEQKLFLWVDEVFVFIFFFFFFIMKAPRLWCSSPGPKLKKISSISPISISQLLFLTWMIQFLFAVFSSDYTWSDEDSDCGVETITFDFVRDSFNERKQ